jgi:hypothetical protein
MLMGTGMFKQGVIWNNNHQSWTAARKLFQECLQVCSQKLMRSITLASWDGSALFRCLTTSRSG